MKIYRKKIYYRKDFTTLNALYNPNINISNERIFVLKNNIVFRIILTEKECVLKIFKKDNESVLFLENYNIEHLRFFKRSWYTFTTKRVYFLVTNDLKILLENEFEDNLWIKSYPILKYILLDLIGSIK
jgi:hypothetical protein